jgi:galactose mutarotase-like enzyme
MKFVGLWHAPKTEAPYMCIEPWTSVPALDNVVDDFETKLEMNRLAPGASYTNSFSITVG